MPFSANFTRVTLVKDDRDTGGDALKVEGKSDGDLQDVTEMHVALPHGGELRTVTVPNVAGAADWVATFPEGASPFKPGEPILVVGVAKLSTRGQPFFVWHETLATTSRRDVS
jgi:hypothetical protein